MRVVLSELEKLEGKFPGLLVKVRTWFQQGTKSADIPQLLQTEYGVTVSVCVVDYYRSHRWAPGREKHALKLDTARVAIEAIGGEAGFDTLLSAKLWELMDKMTIPQLLTARALFIKMRAQNLKEQEFLYKTGQWKPPRPPKTKSTSRPAPGMPCVSSKRFSGSRATCLRSLLSGSFLKASAARAREEL